MLRYRFLEILPRFSPDAPSYLGPNCTRSTRKVFYDLTIKYTDVLGRLLHCMSFSHFFQREMLEFITYPASPSCIGVS